MLNYLFDIVFVLIVLAIAFFASRRGLVHAALIFLAATMASLFATTMFEPVAAWAKSMFLLNTDYIVAGYAWGFFLFAIFGFALWGLLRCINVMLPEPPEMSPTAEAVGSWVFGGMTGMLLAAFLLTAIHTVPAPRNFWGAFSPEAHRRPGPLMALAPDYLYLSFVEYTCENAFAVRGHGWQMPRPVNSAELDQGRWSSFPIRFAIWRREDEESRWDIVHDNPAEETPADLDDSSDESDSDTATDTTAGPSEPAE